VKTSKPRAEITITRNRTKFGKSLIFWFYAFFLLGFGLFQNSAIADARNSAGFIFDHFQLTLEQGERTEYAGPFYYSEQTEDASTVAYPPLYSCYQNPSVQSRENDYLYPLLTSLRYDNEWRWQFFQLLSFSGGKQPSGDKIDRFTLYPFYFYQRATDTNLDYTALAPFYGHLKNRLFHDEIFFVMFPFYAETRKRDVVTDNYLFPFVHVRHGDGLNGWQVWPLVGSEHKIITLHTNGFGDIETVGGHEKSFFFWPLHLKQDTGIGTDNPEKFRASIPLYAYTRSPKLDSTTVLWPFFNWFDNREKKYREWQMPWPFVVFARGEGKTTDRVFPIFSQSQNATKESDSYLWPLYTYGRTHSDPLDLRRTRVLFYLYSDTVEKNTQTGAQKERLDMWPFFTWHRDFNGNERLQILAPLEPAVPDNRGIERNWSPLWSLWRAEANPRAGGTSRSFLWNLYRAEEWPAHKKVSLLFGLFQYQWDGENRRTKLLYFTVSKKSVSQ
jgi:hypothetical protein